MSKLQGRNLVGLFVALTLAAGSASATVIGASEMLGPWFVTTSW
mgnify:CR=1 FL=1